MNGGFQAKGAKEDLNQCLEAEGMDGVKLTQIKCYQMKLLIVNEQQGNSEIILNQETLPIKKVVHDLKITLKF